MRAGARQTLHLTCPGLTCCRPRVATCWSVSNSYRAPNSIPFRSKFPWNNSDSKTKFLVDSKFPITPNSYFRPQIPIYSKSSPFPPSPPAPPPSHTLSRKKICDLLSGERVPKSILLLAYLLCLQPTGCSRNPLAALNRASCSMGGWVLWHDSEVAASIYGSCCALAAGENESLVTEAATRAVAAARAEADAARAQALHAAAVARLTSSCMAQMVCGLETRPASRKCAYCSCFTWTTE